MPLTITEATEQQRSLQNWAGQWEAPRVHGGHNDTPHPCVMCAARWALALDAAAAADEMGQSID